MEKKIKRRRFGVFTVAILLILASIYATVEILDGDLFRDWEAIYLEYNFRDVGESLNKCLAGDKFFYEGVFLRSSRRFSGWSCDHVDNPDKIYTFNYQPERGWQFFCKKTDGTNLIGEFKNSDFEFNRIEDLHRWDEPRYKQTLCPMLTGLLSDISDGKKVLIHCEAGRDRTGAVTAFIAMALAEVKNLPSQKVIEAIECDFEKTPNLSESKIGLMRRRLTKIKKQYGQVQFLKEKCGISETLVLSAAEKFVKN